MRADEDPQSSPRTPRRKPRMLHLCLVARTRFAHRSTGLDLSDATRVVALAFSAGLGLVKEVGRRRAYLVAMSVVALDRQWMFRLIEADGAAAG
jgi:hypothetical protein